MEISLVLALGVGIVLGLLGGGGSMLVVPLLLYVARLPPDDAIALSLLMVSASAAVAMVPHARAGHVKLRAILAVGLPGMLGAFAGGRLSSSLPAPFLLGTLAVVMLAAGARMSRKANGNTATGANAHGTSRLVGLGLGVGFFAGLVGAGGGFLIVPALVLLGGLGLRDAVGTSLAVLAMQAGSGFLAHLGSVHLAVGPAVAYASMMAVGSAAGALAAPHISADKLRIAFGVSTLALGVVLLGDAVGLPPLARAIGAALVLAALGLARAFASTAKSEPVLGPRSVPPRA